MTWYGFSPEPWITSAHGGGPDPAALDPMSPADATAEARHEADEISHDAGRCVRGCWVCARGEGRR